MAGKIIKVPALQGSVALANNISIDFVFPSVGAIDPSRSYISIQANADFTGVGSHALYFNYRGRAPHKNGVLIGDYEIRSSTLGVLEASLQSNIPRVNLGAFERDIDQVAADNYRMLGTQFGDPIAGEFVAGGAFDGTGVGPPGAGWTVGSPFMSAKGGAAPLYGMQPFDVRIPLSELSPMCRQLPVLDLKSLGEVRLRARLDLSQNEVLGEHRPHVSMYGTIPCANIAVGTSVTTIEQVLAAAPPLSADFDIVVGNTVLLTYQSAGATNVSDRVVSAVAAAAGVPLAITVPNPAIPANATNVAIRKVLASGPIPVAGRAFLAPGVATNRYVDLVLLLSPNITGFGLIGVAAVRAALVGRQVALVYPTAAGAAEVWDNATVVAVTPISVAGVMYTRVAIDRDLSAVPNGNGLLYVVSSTPLAPTAVDATLTVLTFAGMTVDRLRLWAGASVRLTSDDGAAPPANKAAVETLVIGIVQAGADVLVTLAAPAPVPAANRRLRLVESTARTLRLSNPMLVLKTSMLSMPVPAPRELAFETWEMEIATIPPDLVSYNHLFMTPVGCSAIFFLCVWRGSAPVGNAAAGNTVISNRNMVASYRVRVNEVPTSVADIVPGDVYHTDSVITALEASPLAMLRSIADGYSQALITATAAPVYDAGDVFIIPALTDPARANSVGLSINFRGPNPATVTLYAVRSQSKIFALR